jgi:hypothetical protein
VTPPGGSAKEAPKPPAKSRTSLFDPPARSQDPGGAGSKTTDPELSRMIAIKPFGPLAELRTLQLLQQMAKLVVLLRQPSAFRNGRIALAR